MAAIESRAGKKYTYTAIVARISEMIRTGALKPGDRLPPERRLAESFGVSRNSLRQAFQALAERRIIESRHGDGTYLLRTMDATQPGQALLAAINDQRGFLRDVLEFRQMLEPQIAALAARRISAKDLDRLKILVCDQQRALLAGREGEAYDIDFHQLLAQSLANRVIDQVLTTTQSILNQTRSTWLQSRERHHASLSGHLRIIDALESGDSEAAFAAMKTHLAEIEGQIFEDPL